MADGEKVAETLEHAYPDEADNMCNYQPKLQAGEYKCVRGTHQLSGNSSKFETFEITGVSGHSGILFHVGNFNKDSDGCVLIGDKTIKACSAANSTLMVTNSKVAFAKLMKLLENVDSFTLIVA